MILCTVCLCQIFFCKKNNKEQFDDLGDISILLFQFQIPSYLEENVERVIIKFILLSERNVNNYLQKSTPHLWNFFELNDLSYLQLFCI